MNDAHKIMESENFADLPFHVLPPPKTHKRIGAILIVISYGIPALLYLIAAYWFFNFRESSKYFSVYFLLILLIGFSLYANRVLSKYGRALRQQDAIDIIRADPRAPILYLRSFNDESVPDYTGSVIPLGPNQTIEMRLARVFKMVGPVISIGIPVSSCPNWVQIASMFLTKIGSWQFNIFWIEPKQ